MQFKIIGKIRHIRTIASGTGLRDRRRLAKAHGAGRWRKLKGFARVQLQDGTHREAELHLVRGDGNWAQGSEDQTLSERTKMATLATARIRYAVCIDNTDYPSSLEPKKVYELLPDPEADAHGQVRVIDESGEDYLFPATYFQEIALSPKAVTRLFGKGSKRGQIRLDTRAAARNSSGKTGGRETSKKVAGKRG